MTRLQKKILAIIGFVSMITLIGTFVTVWAYLLLAFFYHSSSDLHVALVESIVIPFTFVTTSVTLGILKRV
jgi:hypothetical protein